MLYIFMIFFLNDVNTKIESIFYLIHYVCCFIKILIHTHVTHKFP